jgi:hypothetical protein
MRTWLAEEEKRFMRAARRKRMGHAHNAIRGLAFVSLFSAIGCVSRPAPLIVRVTSEPRGAAAQFRCPNTPGVEEQQQRTPARFHVVPEFVRCEVELSKEGWSTRVVPIGRDLIQGGGPVTPARAPITFQRGATPFSVLGALIHRWFDNVTAGISEHLSTRLSPEVRVHVKLDREK